MIEQLQSKFESTKEKYSIIVEFSREVPKISIRLIVKQEEKYTFYAKTLYKQDFMAIKPELFSDPEIIFDCLRTDDSCQPKLAEGEIKIKGILLVGTKKIIKQYTIKLKKQQKSENEMLKFMVTDLRKQIKRLKKQADLNQNEIQLSSDQIQQKNTVQKNESQSKPTSLSVDQIYSNFFDSKNPAGDQSEDKQDKVQCANQ